MRPIDFLKALGVAIGLLVLKVVIAFLAVAVYAYFIDTGHPHEYYEANATNIVRWPVHIVGTALFLLAGHWFAKRRPQRNGLLFAATFTALHMIVDGATVAFKGIYRVRPRDVGQPDCSAGRGFARCPKQCGRASRARRQMIELSLSHPGAVESWRW